MDDRGTLRDGIFGQQPACGARVAVILSRQIEKCRSVIDQLYGAGRHLALRADVGIAAMIVGEILAPKHPIGSRRLFEDRDVRLDPTLIDPQPSIWPTHRRFSGGPLG